MRLGSVGVLATIAALGAMALPATAADRTWNGSAGVNWFTTTNWTANGAAAPTDHLTISSGSPSASGAALRISSGGSILFQGSGTAATFTMCSSSTGFAFSPGYTGAGTLTIQNGAVLTCAQGARPWGVEIGDLADGDGLVTVQGTNSKWTITANSLDVGNYGLGRLAISGGGTVSGAAVEIGNQAGSSGAITVGGSGSGLTSSVWLDVGTLGTGKLTIGVGGTVSAVNSYVGWGGTAKGTATVSGAGATWTNTGLISVGKNGTGTLSISGGGSVSASGFYAGELSGSNGTATIDGASSTLTDTGYLVVGGSDVTTTSGQRTGSLAVTNGAYVSCTKAYVGYTTGATGGITVDGSGSTLSATPGGINSVVDIGRSGTGTLRIANGGLVTDKVGVLGDLVSGNGTAEVTGTGTKWTNSAELEVGCAGTGSLTISGGATVSNATAFVADLGSASRGTVLVSGKGSKWTSGGSTAYVGYYGGGSARVEAGAGADSDAMKVGYMQGSVGSVVVDGKAADGTLSAWTVSSDCHVGGAGQGSLTISGGAKVADKNGYVAHDSGGVGTVTVDGTGSTWSNDQELDVGSLGLGKLIVRNGGLATDYTCRIGCGTDANGLATIDGAGSRWTHNFDLRVGSFGPGSLTVSGGGKVTNATGYVGYNSAGRGKVVVDGSSSTWATTGMLYVGYQGAATMTIRNHGTVTCSDVQVAVSGTASRGDIIVDGVGSLWKPTSSIILGMAGTGTLTVRNGGVVDNATSILGYAANSRGDVTVDGWDSIWNNAGSLIVGRQGTGTLTIRNRGAVFSASGSLGSDVNSSGTAIVDGADSLWSTVSTISVGDGAYGRLTVRGGGQVASGNATLGARVGANGLATVQDAASTWINYGPMYLGGNSDAAGGPGELDVQGGTVQVTGTMKFWPSGIARVTGGSLWASTVALDPAATLALTGGRLSFGTFQGDLVNAGGEVSPALACGPATIQGNFTQSAGRVVIELGDDHYTTQKPTYDRLTVTGQAHLDGTLLLQWLPVAGDATCRFGGNYDVLVYPSGGLDGSLAVDPGELAAYYQGVTTVDMGGGNLGLRVTLRPLIDGDVDMDGRVAVGDLVAMEARFGKAGATWRDGDLNFDQVVDWRDYLLLKSLYDQVGSAGPSQAPEPATFALLGMGGVALIVRRRRTRRTGAPGQG